MDQQQINRRTARRVSRPLSVRYVSRAGGLRSARALDISPTGARLVLPEGAEPLHELTLEFEGKVAVLARTVWHRWSAQGEQMVGVEFEGVHWGLKLALEEFVSELEARAA